MLAELLWPSLEQISPITRSVIDLCRLAIPMADEGLDELGVAEHERRRLLGLIGDRLESGMTPAMWQRITLDRIGDEPREFALAELVEAYLENCASGRPVSEWS